MLDGRITETNKKVLIGQGVKLKDAANAQVFSLKQIEVKLHSER